MIAEEQKFNEVRDFLDSEIVRLGELIEEYKNDIKVQGEDFNMDNPNGGMYSGMELTQIHHEMEKKMIYSQEAANDIEFFKKMRSAPYFARVDFKIDGALKEKTVYIGLKTVQDPETFQMYVCDWRAPIASLFYEDFEDKAFFDAPKGRIYGDLLLKRQYKFQDGCLYYYVDSDKLSLGDILVKEGINSYRYELCLEESIDGVYTVNKGYAVFRRIYILGEQDDYYIVQEGIRKGVSKNDHIALVGSKISEYQIIY
jgi:DNA helicase-2/ATP-dependent DNA helicase PcrA